MTTTNPQVAAAEAQDNVRRERFPAIPDELLVALAREFPDRCPTRGMTVEEVWLAAGAASVTRWLAHVAVWQRTGRAPEGPEADEEFTFTQALLGDLEGY